MDNAPGSPPHGWCGRGRFHIMLIIFTIVIVKVVCVCTSTSNNAGFGYGLRLGDRFGLLHGVYRLSFHHVQSRWSVCVQIDFRSHVGSSLLLFCSGFVNRFHVLRAAISMVAVRPALSRDAGQSFVLGAAGGTLRRYTSGHIHRCIVNVVARFTEGSFTNIQDKDARTING